MATRRIGQILVDMGFITDEQQQLLVEEQQQQPGALFGKIAEDMGLITDEQLAQALAEQMNMKVVQLADVSLPQISSPKSRNRWLNCIASFQYVLMATPLRLLPATAKPDDPRRTSNLFGLRHSNGGLHEREIKAAIEKYYSSDLESFERIVDELKNDEENCSKPRNP